MHEIWKSIPGHEGLYEASSLGRIRSLDRVCIGPSGRARRRRGIVMKPTLDDGYFVITLCSELGARRHRVHRLVAAAFIGDGSVDAVTNHLDGNKQNNCVSNLEWTTVQGNTNHSYANGLQLGRKGVKHHNTKLSESDVRSIVQRLSAGESQCSLGRAFGVGQAQISLINLGKRWDHLDLREFGAPPYSRRRAA
ncbi:NUMOD4 domain-containing protein [Pseudomonas syringae]|uniref:NUMOD4 domain-containing protein n=1 Tax=Pseudomonas syringae TaxID=317 RepID=UPI000E31BB1D|nr:NUMOD4 domain-containing protein [Pseudomonas syringae]